MEKHAENLKQPIGMYRMGIVFLTLFLVFSLIPLHSAASSQKRENVRVGFFPFEGYQMMSEDGNRSGYGYEYLQRMLNFAGWKYTYVGYEENISWSEAQQMLIDGDIDLLTSAVKTPERLQKFDFSEDPIGTSAAILTVRSGDTKYSANDYANWNGMKIGLLKGNSRNDSLADFAKEKGFTYTPVLFETQDELKAALADKKVDAIVTSNLRQLKDEWLLAKFDTKPFYVIVKKGNTRLLDQVNYAIQQVEETSPGIQEELFRKYYSADTGEQIGYTAQEKDFIARCTEDKKVFHAIIDPDCKPFSYTRGGNITGCLTEISKEIFDRTGLDVEFNVPISHAQYLKALSKDTVDIVCDMTDAYSDAEASGYILTDSYYSTTIAKVYLKTASGGNGKAAYIEGSSTAEALTGWISDDVDMIGYESLSDCIHALRNGEVGAAYLYTGTAQNLIYYDDTNKLTCTTIPSVTINFCMGIRNTEDYLLSAVMERALLSISEDDISAIAIPYTINESKRQTLLGLFYDQPFTIVAAVTGVFVLLFLVFGLLMMHRKQLAEEKSNLLLKEAVENAQLANQAKSRFLSQMSHEIRTPMNAIVGLSAIARQYENDPHKIEEYLTKIDTASKVLLNIINDILDMSAIEGGKMKIAVQEFDMKGILNGIVNIYYTQCRQKGIRFELDSDIRDEMYFGDSLRVNQILMNLVSNAYKFTQTGGSIHITVKETESKGDVRYIKFVVKDTGIGMSEEMLGRLFKPFEQENADTARKYGGSGLGMSITQNLVQMMHGSIHATSEKGKGTTFIVELPFKCTNRPGNKSSGDISGIHALVVDDESNTCNYTGAILGRIGVKYDVAADGAKALLLMQDRAEKKMPYDVCFIDWKMPEMNGLDVTRQIRKMYGPDILIIIVSAYDLSEIEEEAREAGVDQFLSKPLFQSTVFNMLLSVSDHRNGFSKEEKETFDFTGHRVLIAEDNELNQEVAKGLLSMVHMEADFTGNGQEAVEQFEKMPPWTYDAILMDIQMPVMNGYEAARAIRKLVKEDAAKITIYAMTADAFTEDISKAFEAGMNGHIAKPIDAIELYRNLQSACSDTDIAHPVHENLTHEDLHRM